MTTLLIDGNNLVMRGLFAMRRAALSAHGVSTGPLMVTINGLARVVQTEQPDRLLVAWDGGVSTKRRAIDPQYKAHRTPITGEEKEFREGTFGLVKEFFALAGVPTLRLEGMEADDIIAAAWAAERDDKIVIVSSDKDFLQLVGQNPLGVETELVRLSSAETETDRWTEHRMWNETGYGPERWPLVTALTGDAVDGVPGVPGIGPKRAVKLLEDAGWDLEAAAAEVARKKPHEATRIASSYALVNLRDTRFPVSVPSWQPTAKGSIAWDPLVQFLERYELEQILGKLRSGALWRPSGASPLLPGRAFQGRTER